MNNWGIKEEDLTSTITKIELENYISDKNLSIKDIHTKIELIRKHREMFGSDLLTAKKSIEKMFY
jgi:ribosomal protein L7/L12